MVKKNYTINGHERLRTGINKLHRHVLYLLLGLMCLHYHDSFTAQRKQATRGSSELCIGLLRHTLSACLTGMPDCYPV